MTQTAKHAEITLNSQFSNLSNLQKLVKLKRGFELDLAEISRAKLGGGDSLPVVRGRSVLVWQKSGFGNFTQDSRTRYQDDGGLYAVCESLPQGGFACIIGSAQ